MAGAGPRAIWGRRGRSVIMREVAMERQHFDGFDAGTVWDEYRWEAFIRRQDAQAGEYMAMLEYYGDEPDSHNLIARSMGWTHLLTNCRDEPDPQRCQTCAVPVRQGCAFYAAHLGLPARAPFGDEGADWMVQASRGPTDRAGEVEWARRYTAHAVRPLAVTFARRLHTIARALENLSFPAECPFCRLLHHAGCCTGKITAALAAYTPPAMRGLAITYLKMAYHAASAALGQIAPCVQAGKVRRSDAADATRQLLAIRTHLTILIDEFRAQLASL